MLVLLSLATRAWSQQLDVKELETTTAHITQFQNYEGHEPVVESIQQIAGIGGVLSRSLLADNGKGSYFGKYIVIRAYQPSLTLLSADIIVFSSRATIDNIRNVQRLVAGYLLATFGYDSGRAHELAVLVTRYNAAYRGDINALSQRYTPLVMSYLSPENAGIAANYSEWPGKTRLVVPLQRAAGAQATVPPRPAAPTQAPSSPKVPATGTGPEKGPKPAETTGGAPSAPGVPSSAAPSTQTPGQVSPGSERAGTSAPSGAEAPKGGSVQPGVAVPGPSAGAIEQPNKSPGAAARTGPGHLTAFLHGINWWWLLALGALLLLALLVWIIARAVISTASEPSFDQDVRRSIQTGHPLIEMIAVPQNRRIGHRNVHYLKPGATASVGGGRSRFLIYFVPVPRRMALLKYDGRSYTFVPLKTGLFPGVENPVDDCLGKSIAARSLKGYQFTIIFHKFVPPLEEINRIMRSILPGSRQQPE